MTFTTLINRSILVLFVISLSANLNLAKAQKKLKKSISIQSTQTIQATPQEVYNVLSELERYSEWSPFLVADPEQKNNVTGENGQVGSTFHWEGVAEKSQGSQTLTEIKNNEYLRMECTIEKPFKSNPVFEYRILETENGVEVVQDFSLQLSGFDNFMMKLFGVKKHMTTTNQLGLDRLKTLVENGNSLSAND